MTAANFDRSLSLVLRHEGGYVNHRADPGGPTNLGVTLATARRLGVDVDGDGDTDITDIKLLKPEHAAKVYRHSYWNTVRGDDLPSGVDYAVFDFGVNSGPSRAIKFLQRELGVRIDGVMGPVTLDAVHAAEPAALVRKICAARLAWMRRLKTWKTFGKGWKRRVAGVEQTGVEMALNPPVAELTDIIPGLPNRPVRERSSRFSRGACQAIIAFVIAAFGWLNVERTRSRRR